MLRRCIPRYRLPDEILSKEIERIKNLGVKIKTGVTIGEELKFSDLWDEGYKAIFVGAGAQKSQRLRIDGMDLKGVIHALDYLWSVNSRESTGKNKKFFKNL